MNPSPAPAPAPARLASIDAYRGFVMLLMMGELLRLKSVARALPESGRRNKGEERESGEKPGANHEE